MAGASPWLLRRRLLHPLRPRRRVRPPPSPRLSKMLALQLSAPPRASVEALVEVASEAELNEAVEAEASVEMAETSAACETAWRLAPSRPPPPSPA